jgi:hypothetical protein
MSNDICPDCWHEDCTCGITLAQRAADANALAAREAAERLAGERADDE